MDVAIQNLATGACKRSSETSASVTFIQASPAYAERQMWQAQVTCRMIPTHKAITELEAKLSALAAKYDGEADGWGSFSQR